MCRYVRSSNIVRLEQDVESGKVEKKLNSQNKKKMLIVVLLQII